MAVADVAIQTILSPLLWIAVIFVLIVFSIGGLWIRKQRKLEYQCFVIRKTGNGKVDMKIMKAGWFKSKKILGGLMDWSGELQLETGGFRQPVDKIQAGSTIDFHEIDGKKGLICRRKDDDPKILVPLTKIDIVNDEILGAIASADLRDASVNIVRQAEKETRNRTQEIVQWIIMGGVIMLALIVIIMSYQFVSKAQDQSWEYVLQAEKIVSGAIPAGSSAGSTAP